MNQVERGLLNHERRIDELEELLSRVNQRSYAAGASQGSGGGGSFYLGKSASTITAASGGTFGSGTVERYDFSTATPTATGLTETVYNADTAIAAGKWVMVGRPANGLPLASPLQC